MENEDHLGSTSKMKLAIGNHPSHWHNPNIHFYILSPPGQHTHAQQHTHQPESHPPLSELSGTWPALGASSVKLASSLGCADARVRRLRWGCCTWQGLVLHHVFHSCFAPSCGCRRKRLWLRRSLWLELPCRLSGRVEFTNSEDRSVGGFCCNGTSLSSF